jgi:hypothetical protein
MSRYAQMIKLNHKAVIKAAAKAVPIVARSLRKVGSNVMIAPGGIIACKLFIETINS